METTFHTDETHLVLAVPYDGLLIDREGFVSAIQILIDHTSFTDMTDEDIREIVEKELKRCWGAK